MTATLNPSSSTTSDLLAAPRKFTRAEPGDPALGPLALLPGTWVGNGTGWNMIALPFAAGPGRIRLLLNQFDEILRFDTLDGPVPNRGIGPVAPGQLGQTDQAVTAIDYEQAIEQVAVVDEPVTDDATTGRPHDAIHHEPGLFLHIRDQNPDGFDIARLATIPHGDAVLALGKGAVLDGPARIPTVDGLPDGASHDLTPPPPGRPDYLAPYRQFRDHPFFGTVPAGAPGFPGFDPTAPQELLRVANANAAVRRTTVLDLDTTNPTGGIHNIPFVVAQANAVSMRSTFWIQEMEDRDPQGNPQPPLRLQYLQVVMLEFFPRFDGLPGRIGWPHVSINTLVKQ